MRDDLIQKFYDACPLWWWPVLWVQIILMDARLIQLRERAGEEIDYGIALGRCGSLHLIFLSDNARGNADPDAWHMRPNFSADDLSLEDMPDYLWHNILILHASSVFAARTAAAAQTPAYLDPG
jgi:hypothetical protein